jgi:hypothetical protein
MSPAQAAIVKRAQADAVNVVKSASVRAANDEIADLKPLSAQAAIAAQEMVARGIPPGKAIRAAADVASHQFMMTRLSRVGQDWAHLSPAAPQVTLNRLRGEF